jgi:hypothetical protein
MDFIGKENLMKARSFDLRNLVGGPRYTGYTASARGDNRDRNRQHELVFITSGTGKSDNFCHGSENYWNLEEERGTGD